MWLEKYQASAVKWPEVKVGAEVTLVAPTPQYGNGKCCQDYAHITNFGRAEYDLDILCSITQHIGILES
jgi:hypothetical protein